MTWPVVLAVLFGALLHASWNALVKSSHDKALALHSRLVDAHLARVGVTDAFARTRIAVGRNHRAVVL